MKLKALIISAMLSITFAGCASKIDKSMSSSLPEWIANPSFEGGFADTQCLPNNGPIGILRNQAIALARAELGRQINVKAQSMDKVYQNMTSSNADTTIGSSFETISRLMSDEVLQGSRLVNFDLVKFPDQSVQVCAMVAYPADKVETLYKEIMDKSGRVVSPQNNNILYQQFKAERAQQELKDSF